MPQLAPSLRDPLESKLTRSQPDGLDVVLRHVVLDPGPVNVAVIRLLRVRVVEEHLCHGAVAEGTWRQRDLEGEQILAVADVEEESRVRGASCGESVKLSRRKQGAWARGGAANLPCFSGVLSISSIEIPNDLQYSICNLISWKMCVTISLDCGAC